LASGVLELVVLSDAERRNSRVKAVAFITVSYYLPSYFSVQFANCFIACTFTGRDAESTLLNLYLFTECVDNLILSVCTCIHRDALHVLFCLPNRLVTRHYIQPAILVN
jgi:hypothetical protein